MVIDERIQAAKDRLAREGIEVTVHSAVVVAAPHMAVGVPGVPGDLVLREDLLRKLA